LRYDASESVAVKLQYDYTQLRRQEAIHGLALQVGFTFYMSNKMQFGPRVPVMFVAAVLLLKAAPGRSFGGAGYAQTTSGQSLAIIVNQSNPVENLSFTELRRIFLGERSHWPNGRRITLEDRSEEHTSELQSRGHLVC